MRQSTAIQGSVQCSHPDVNTGIADIGTGCDDPGVDDALVALLKAVDQPVVVSVTEGSLLNNGCDRTTLAGCCVLQSMGGVYDRQRRRQRVVPRFHCLGGCDRAALRVDSGYGHWSGGSRLAQALTSDQVHQWFPVATAVRDDRGLNAFLHHCFTHHGQSFAALIHADGSLFPLSSTKGNHE